MLVHAWGKQHATNKANSSIGLLRRNLRIPSQTIKTHAYQSLVRPHLEYMLLRYWTHIPRKIYKLDMIQVQSGQVRLQPIPQHQQRH